jgi:hypothetical protein
MNKKLIKLSVVIISVCVGPAGISKMISSKALGKEPDDVVRLRTEPIAPY